MSSLVKLLNGICSLLYKREYKRFISDCDIRKVQEKYLLKLVRKNSKTVYGRKFDFKNIRSYEDFAKKVPLCTYEDYEPYINAMADGENNVLTKERPILFEVTP